MEMVKIISQGFLICRGTEICILKFIYTILRLKIRIKESTACPHLSLFLLTGTGRVLCVCLASKFRWAQSTQALLSCKGILLQFFV
jgi:hypothetical protein